MKKSRYLLAGVVAGISALAVSSCAYDPYYSGGAYSGGGGYGGGYGSGYGGGYGSGYGYGSSGFSTSFFVSTGSPRWGYDPYAGAYYDYGRHCYYDPYLSGYYPTGYRPRYVVGSPHPHGWSHGSHSIQPPSQIHSHNLTNYQNRGERYRNLGRDWSSNVRVSSQTDDHHSPSFREGQSRQPGYTAESTRRERPGRESFSGRENLRQGSPQQIMPPQRGADRGGQGRGGFDRQQGAGVPSDLGRGGHREGFSGGDRNHPAMEHRTRGIERPQPQVQPQPRPQPQAQPEQQPEEQFAPSGRRERPSRG